MVLLSPIRRRPLAFWPIFLGIVAFNLAVLFIEPAYCSASSAVGGVWTSTSCSSLVGIPCPADATGAGASAGSFMFATGIAVLSGIAVFVLTLAGLYAERTKGRRSDGSGSATA
jgi:hypothetical protein